MFDKLENMNSIQMMMFLLGKVVTEADDLGKILAEIEEDEK